MTRDEFNRLYAEGAQRCRALAAHANLTDWEALDPEARARYQVYVDEDEAQYQAACDQVARLTSLMSNPIKWYALTEEERKALEKEYRRAVITRLKRDNPRLAYYLAVEVPVNEVAEELREDQIRALNDP